MDGYLSNTSIQVIDNFISIYDVKNCYSNLSSTHWEVVYDHAWSKVKRRAFGRGMEHEALEVAVTIPAKLAPVLTFPTSCTLVTGILLLFSYLCCIYLKELTGYV